MPNSFDLIQYTQTPIDCIDDIAHRRQIEAEIRGKWTKY